MFGNSTNGKAIILKREMDEVNEYITSYTCMGYHPKKQTNHCTFNYPVLHKVLQLMREGKVDHKQEKNLQHHLCLIRLQGEMDRVNDYVTSYTCMG